MTNTASPKDVAAQIDLALVKINATAAVKALKAEHAGEPVKLSRGAQRAVRYFASAKRAAAKAEARKKKYEAQILAALGSAEAGLDDAGNRIVTLGFSSNGSNSSEVLMTRFPDAYVASHTDKPYSFVKAL